MQRSWRLSIPVTIQTSLFIKTTSMAFNISMVAGGRRTTTRKPPSTPRTTRNPEHPTNPGPTSGYCPLSAFCRDFDAIEVVEGVIHVFKGQYYGLLMNDGMLYTIGRINDKWPELPSNLDAVMATSRYVYFFKGGNYWRQDKNSGPEGGALSRREIRYGFRGAPENLDAAFVWSGNGRIYFIKGDQYYRYRGGAAVDPEYPLPLSVWKNVRAPVDDVFQHPDGMTYFFSGERFQIFDDMKFGAGEPQVTRDWVHCCSPRSSRMLQFAENICSKSTTINSSISFILLSTLSAFFYVLAL